MKLTEQQIEDLFKDAPEGYNYYAPESEDWYEAWFIVKDDAVIKVMRIDSKRARNCLYCLEDLLKCGAIKRPDPKETSIIKFNLEKALAGEKVITRDGQEVTQLVKFDVEDDCYQVYGVLNGALERWVCTGDYDDCLGEHHLDLFMAPKMLSGYIACCSNNITKTVDDLKAAKLFASQTGCELLALVDLSKIEEGHGL